jgi:hypothetical protein
MKKQFCPHIIHPVRWRVLGAAGSLWPGCIVEGNILGQVHIGYIYLPVDDILLQCSQSSNSLGCCETTDAAKIAKP